MIYIGEGSVIKVIWQSNDSKIIQLSTTWRQRTDGGGEGSMHNELMMSLEGNFGKKKGFSVLFCFVLNLEAHSLIVQDHYSVA